MKRTFPMLLSALAVCLSGQTARAGDAEATPPPPAEAEAPSEPEAAPPSEPAQQAPAQDGKLDQLEAEFHRIMDELVQARTRTAVLSKTLFRTPIEVRVVRRADDQRLSHLTLRLDGVAVHDSEGAALARGEATLFSGFAAPGAHELAIEIREQAKDNASYEYTRSERFRFEVKKDTRTEIEVVLRDDSNMARKLPAGKAGEYDVQTVVRVRAKKVEKP